MTPIAFAKSLVETLGQSEAETFALEEATKNKTPFWVDVVLQVMTPVQAGQHDKDRPTVVLSYGLGVDSTAILLRWMLEPKSRDFDLKDLLVITAMTGNEWPISGQLVVDHILPLMRKHHVRYVQVARAGLLEGAGIEVLDDSRHPTKLFLTGSYTLAQEMLEGGTVPQYSGDRICSMHAKGGPLDTFVTRTVGAHPFRHAIGFESKEIKRVAKDVALDVKKAAQRAKGRKVKLPGRVGWFPLVEWGWDRKACEEYIKAKTGVNWPKSACSFCVFTMSSDEKRQTMIAQWAADPKQGLLALLMEHVSVSLNPEQGFRGQARMSDQVRIHAPALWAKFEKYLEKQQYAVYEVSRSFNPYIDKHGKEKQNVARRVLKIDDGTREEMEKLLGKVGPVERDRDGIARVWVRRQAGTRTDREQLVAVAPATVLSKTGPAFDTTWIAAALAAGEQLEPAGRRRLPIHA